MKNVKKEKIKQILREELGLAKSDTSYQPKKSATSPSEEAVKDMVNKNFPGYFKDIELDNRNKVLYIYLKPDFLDTDLYNDQEVFIGMGKMLKSIGIWVVDTVYNNKRAVILAKYK